MPPSSRHGNTLNSTERTNPIVRIQGRPWHDRAGVTHDLNETLIQTRPHTMTVDHDVHMVHSDPPATGPARHVPRCDDIPVTGEYAAQRSLPRSVVCTGARATADVAAVPVHALAGINAYLRRKIGDLRQQARRRRYRMAPYAAFAREMFAGPRAIGAVCPSWPHLARAMAGELDNIGDGLVLELGAGTGSITHALLQQGVAPTRLIAVERSPALAAHLRKRFPAIRVIEGDAAQLGNLIGNDANRVRAVVSGLPLRSLPRAAAQEIGQQIRHLLPDDGVLVQFTYDLRTPSVWRDSALKNERTRIVWNNLPPARVDTFVRKADSP